MTRLRAHGLAAMFLLALVAAGCSGSAGGNGSTGDSGANGGNGGGGNGGGNVPAGAGDLSKVDSCSLLTPAEIQQVVAKPFKAGVNQDSDIVKQCEWDQQNDPQLVTVGLTVRAFDPQDWQVVAEFPKAQAVSGLGEAAYKNSPLAGDLSVKYHGYEIDMGIVNFGTQTQDQIDQANVDLMKIVLTRL